MNKADIHITVRTNEVLVFYWTVYSKDEDLEFLALCVHILDSHIAI